MMRPYLVKRRSHLAGSGWKRCAYDLGASSSKRMSEESLLRHFKHGYGCFTRNCRKVFQRRTPFQEIKQGLNQHTGPIETE